MTSEKNIKENKILIKKISAARIPTSWGEFVCHVYESTDNGVEHLAFVSGEINETDDILVRVHSECITGDIFQSQKCDCGAQLHDAMKRIADEDGILVYLRGHEGRGIGIGHKIDAYRLQEQGLDTVQANEALGLPVDSREYGVGAEILKDLGVTSIRLITNNPTKLFAFENHGVLVSDRIGIPAYSTPENISYLRTKNEKMGHLIEGLEST